MGGGPRIIGDPDPLRVPGIGGPPGNLVGPNSQIFHPRGPGNYPNDPFGGGDFFDPTIPGGMPPDWRHRGSGPDDLHPDLPGLGRGRGGFGRGGFGGPGFHDPFGGRGGFGGGFGGGDFGGGGFM